MERMLRFLSFSAADGPGLSCATLLLAAGENVKVVSERLGHASAALTLDVYSHVLPDMQQQAPERLDRILFPAK